MNVWLRSGISLLAVAFSLSAGAALKPEAQQSVKDQLKKTLPEFKVEQLEETPIKGLYEASSGPSILYVSPDARYVMTGEIIDLNDSKKNLTEESRKNARVKAIDEFEKNMIVYSAPKSEYTVTVFTDPTCGYCRKFHDEISKVNELGISVQYLAFPRGGKQSRGYEQILNVWCADDKADALTKAKHGESVPSKTCENHRVDDMYELGINSGVRGTPSIILEDGTMLPGYMPADKLLTFVKKAKGNS